MATCANCKANVGCGCSLTNGLCASCYAISKQVTQRIRNVISKVNQLCKL